MFLSELERESEVSAERYQFLFCAKMWVPLTQVANNPFLIFAAALCSIRQFGKLVNYLVVSASTELTKPLGGWSLVANALLLGSPWG